MAKHSPTESESMILALLRSNGEKGLTLDELHRALCQDGQQSKTLTKKLLQRLKTRGLIRSRIDRDGIAFTLVGR